jgi:hypothetical protein
MNAHVLGSARYYKYTGGHCCWNTWYIPTWNENSESVYTWMLKQKRPGTTFANPEANAGRDSTIPHPTTSLTLKGAGNDPVGNPINFTWSKISGPASGTIVTPANAQTNISGLGVGTYKFELKVVNPLGGIGKDTITINNGNLVLPIKLIDLTVSEFKNRILLQWSTSTEVNASHFIVERSINGTEYEEVGNVPAVGNSNVIQHYQFTDISSFKGIIYYRLRMVDIDATFANSKVVTINAKDIDPLSIDIISISFHSDMLQMIVNATDDKQLKVMITDAAGRVIHRHQSIVTRGNNSIVKTVVASRGIYYATFLTEDGNVTKTILHH